MPGNDKYDYALKLARHFSYLDFDEDGEPCGEHPHYTCFTNDKAASRALERVKLTGKEDVFYKNEGIIPVIEAYGLDKERFWYAVVYVALLTQLWSQQKSIKPLPTALEQLTTMRDKIMECHEFKVVIDNALESHSFVMAGNRLVRQLLVQSLDELIDKESASSMARSHEVPTWRMKESYKKTEMTWYAANLFRLLFKILELPVLRSRSVKKEYRTIQGRDMLIKGRDAVVSYDKNQLIAELIHFLGLTDNPDLDGNSIRAILRSEREFNLDII